MKTLIQKALDNIAKDHRNKVLEECAQLWDRSDTATRNSFARFLRSKKEV